MIEVEMEWYEVLAAATVGVSRMVESIRNGNKHAFGYDGSKEWQDHIEGACGEKAFAKALGRYWSGSVNTFKRGGDVGNVQIRTRSLPNYDLIVRTSDRDDDVFVLVIGRAPRYRVIGWIHGRDAKNPRFQKTYGGRPPAYFVPQSALHPIEKPNTQTGCLQP